MQHTARSSRKNMGQRSVIKSICRRGQATSLVASMLFICLSQYSWQSLWQSASMQPSWECTSAGSFCGRIFIVINIMDMLIFLKKNRAGKINFPSPVFHFISITQNHYTPLIALSCRNPPILNYSNHSLQYDKEAQQCGKHDAHPPA